MKKCKILTIIIVLIIIFISVLRKTDYADLKQEKSIQLVQDGTYTISSAIQQNIVLDVDNNSWNENANIAVWNRNYQNNQKFNIKYLKDGYYKIEVVSSGKYMTVNNSNNIIQKEYEDSDNQKWYFKDAGNGNFYIISKINSLYLDIYGGEIISGKNVGVYEGHQGNNQKFKFDKIDVVKGSKTISNGKYNISSALSFDNVFDVNGASNFNNANIALYSRNNNENQKFSVEYTDDGYYKIVANHSKKVLTVQGASIEAGANVVQYQDLGIDAQKWVIRSAGDGYYYVISKCNGLFLDLQGGVATSGTNIEVYNANYSNWQKFKFYNAEINAKETVKTGNYVITSCLQSGKAIDIQGDVILNGANVEIWSNGGQNNQKFIVTYLGDGYYTIKAFSSNKVLTVQKDSRFNGANVVQQFYYGTDNQKWAIVKNDDKTYSIISKSSGLYLDVQGAFDKDGANIDIYENNGCVNQKFNFWNTEFSRTIDDGKYAIITGSNSNKAVDIEWGSTDNGANAEIWDWNEGSNQSFDIKYCGNGYYKIIALCSQKALTAKNGNVEQQEDKDLDTQKWAIQKSDYSGNYSFRNKSNDYYLDIYYNKMDNGTNIEIYPGNDEFSQKFKLKELIYNGIDVSSNQGKIDWKKVKNQIDFTIIKVGVRYWGSGLIGEDRMYKTNIENAIKEGIPCGVYFYSQAINEEEGIKEAEWTLEKIRGYKISYPVIIDTESTGNGGRADYISVEDRTKAVKAFCKKVKEAGYTPMIYSNKDWIINSLDMSQLSEYDIWLAHYVKGAPRVKSDYKGEYTIWQYSSSGRIDGIEDVVDMDIGYRKY